MDISILIKDVKTINGKTLKRVSIKELDLASI